MCFTRLAPEQRDVYGQFSVPLLLYTVFEFDGI